MSIDNTISKQIWQDRYQKNKESYEDNLKRVSNFCSNNEKERQSFYDLMAKKLFFPAGRTMSNAGLGSALTLNNCFTLNFVNDSIEEIFETVKNAAKTHQRGGGTGFEFSKVRPNGTPTSNDAIASGVISFLNVFDAQTKTINQGSRRGANMSVLSIYHPDIYDYIDAKSYDEGKLTHFNLSIMIDDDFMEAVKANKTIDLHYPVYDDDGFYIKDESLWTHKKNVNARNLWNLIIQKAYDTGELGVLFYDNMNKDNNVWYLENIVNTNPCAEYLAGVVFKDETTKKYKGACNLGSIFLHNLIENPFTSQASINKDLLKNTISNAIKLLDNIIDKNRFPLKDYEDYQKNLRTIGLGYTGLANMSAMMGYKYGSKEHIEWIDEILNVIAYESYMTSIELAKEKGSFNLLDKEKFIQSGFIQKHLKKYPEWQNVIDGIKKHGIRNARLLSVAPTGTLSLTYGENCSSGVEPVFALSTKRIVKIGGQEDVNAQEVEFNDYGYDLWKSIKGEKISNEVFVTAQDLSVEDHIEVLKVVAFHTDMSVSKTINIPTEYSFEQTKGVYFKCWESGIKGCTIFRPNEIRKGIFITDDQTKQNEDELGYTHQDLPRGMIYEVDDDLIGKKEKIVSGCGNMHLQAWFDPQTGQLMEVFLAKGANGICNSFMTSLSRQISLNLRGGVPIEAVVDQLKSTPTCPSYSVRSATKRDTSKGSSCPSAIGNIIEKMQREVYEELGIGDDEDYEIKIKPVPKKEIAHVIKDKTDKEKFLDENGEIAFAMRYKECPQCHNELDQGDGCYSCHDCGWTKC